MVARRLTAAALAVAVVLATSGGVAPAPQVADDLAEPTVTVEGGESPVDPETVYRRVADLQGVEYATLPDVTVVVTDRADRNATDLARVSRFERLLGIEPRAPDLALAGLARPGEVYLYTDVVRTPAERERVLAHEFAHVIQFHQDAFRTVYDRLADSEANRSRLRTAVVEGSASYVEHRYAVEYLDADPDPPWAELRANRTQFEAYLLAPYHFGNRYVDGRIDSPAALPGVYDDPPRTSEQLLHGDAAGPPAELSVQLDGFAEGSVVDRRTQGELFVRLLLEGELGLDRAAEAAAGWGNDELVVLDDGNYAWALRWDDPSEADEFEAVMREFLSEYASAAADRWERDGVAYGVERASDETVVVFVGDAGFVENASAVGTDDEVTVDATDGEAVDVTDEVTVDATDGVTATVAATDDDSGWTTAAAGTAGPALPRSVRP